jgi:hypothetical protein
MIAQMGEIFQQAQEVVVGLGQESDGDERAIVELRIDLLMENRYIES